MIFGWEPFCNSVSLFGLKVLTMIFLRDGGAALLLLLWPMSARIFVLLFERLNMLKSSLYGTSRSRGNGGF